MNTKKISALVASALIATMGQAMAATTVTKTITVQWNTQALASLTVTTQASASQAHAAGGETIYWNGNTSTSSGCNGTTNVANAGSDTSANGVVNFGNVTPDSGFATDCLEVNAAAAYVTTNDTLGYSVGVSATAVTGGAALNAAGGQELCIYPDGAYANNLAYTASARVAAVVNPNTTACAAAGIQVPTVANTTNLLPSTGANGQTAGTTLNSDIELVVDKNAPTGAQSATLTYSLVAN